MRESRKPALDRCQRLPVKCQLSESPPTTHTSFFPRTEMPANWVFFQCFIRTQVRPFQRTASVLFSLSAVSSKAQTAPEGEIAPWTEKALLPLGKRVGLHFFPFQW